MLGNAWVSLCRWWSGSPAECEPATSEQSGQASPSEAKDSGKVEDKLKDGDKRDPAAVSSSQESSGGTPGKRATVLIMVAPPTGFPQVL